MFRKKSIIKTVGRHQGREPVGAHGLPPMVGALAGAVVAGGQYYNMSDILSQKSGKRRKFENNYKLKS